MTHHEEVREKVGILLVALEGYIDQYNLPVDEEWIPCRQAIEQSLDILVNEGGFDAVSPKPRRTR